MKVRASQATIFFLSLIAPAVLSVALTQTWYQVRLDSGAIYQTFGGLDTTYGRVALGCALAYIALTLLSRRYLALTSVVLSVVALVVVIAARPGYDYRTGETTAAFGLALVAAVVWSTQAVLTLLLWPKARTSVPKTLSTIAETPTRIRSARLWHPDTVDRSERSTVVERWALGIGLALAGAAVIGAFGPWVKASSGLASLSVSGTDGSNDGWLVVACAGIGAAALLVGAARDSIRLMLLSALAGLAGAGVAIYDRHHAQSTIDSSGGDGLFAQIGWGLNLAIVASIGLAISAIVLMRSARGAFRRSVADETHQPIVTVDDAAPLAQTDMRGTSSSATSDLERLAELHARGALDDDEFRCAKQRVLGE